MEFSVRSSRNVERAKLFDPCDPVDRALLFAVRRGFDHFRYAGKQQSGEWRYRRRNGGFQESQDVHVPLDWFGRAVLRHHHHHMDSLFWSGVGS